MQQRLARIALLLIAMGSLPSALIAQASAYAPACPAGKTPLIDSSEVVVELAAGDGWHDRRYSDEQRLRILYYADAIGQRFVAPLTLGEIPVLAEMPRGAQQRDNGARLVLSGSLVLLVAPDGRMHLLAWQQRPLSAPLAQALTNAARMAEDSGNFASILPAGQTKGIDTLLLALRSLTVVGTSLSWAPAPSTRNTWVAVRLVPRSAWMISPPRTVWESLSR